MGCSFVLLSFRLTLASPCHIISIYKVPFIGLPFLRGVHNLLSLGGYLRTSFYLVYFICWKLHDLSSTPPHKTSLSACLTLIFGVLNHVMSYEDFFRNLINKKSRIYRKFEKPNSEILVHNWTNFKT